jgi:hypothetical protein
MDEQKQRCLIIAVSFLGIFCVALWVLLLVLLSGSFLGGRGIAQATPTLPPPLVCTPPACIEGEVYHCEGECPGGCGVRCATPPPPTAPPPTVPPTAPPPTTPPPTTADIVSATETPVVAATVAPTPTKADTETPAPTYQFVHDEVQRVEGPCGVYGHVYDAAGRPLEGVRITARSEWGWKLESPAISKPVAAPDAGYYDIILDVAAGNWTVQVVDEAGLPISDEASFVHGGEMTFCHYVIDWRRTF